MQHSDAWWCEQAHFENLNLKNDIKQSLEKEDIWRKMAIVMCRCYYDKDIAKEEVDSFAMDMVALLRDEDNQEYAEFVETIVNN